MRFSKQIDTRSKIFRYIRNLPERSIFCTRDMLNFGSRSAVDNAMFNMVHEQIIERLAWGVFRMHPLHLKKILPPVKLLDVVLAKIDAFTREPFFPSFRLFDERDEPVPTFGMPNEVTVSIVGHSSSFRRVYEDESPSITVKLRAIAPRKAALARSRDGGILTALWRLGRKGLKKPMREFITTNLIEPVKPAVIKRSKMLPAWITNHYLHTPQAIPAETDGATKEINQDIIDLLKKQYKELHPEDFIDDESDDSDDSMDPKYYIEDDIPEGHDLEDGTPPEPDD